MKPLHVCLSLVTALVLVACGRAAKHPVPADDSPYRPAVEALRGYLQTGEAERLTQARSLLPPDGRERSSAAGDAVPVEGEQLVVDLLDVAQGGPVPGGPLREAVLRELLRDRSAGLRLLDILWTGTIEDSEFASEDSYVQVIYRCTRPGRDSARGPLLDFLDLKPGQVVLDLGSGPGYYTFPMAKRVGPEGRVVAVEVNDHILDFVRRHARETGYGNVEPWRGGLHDIRVPANSADVAFMTHMFVDIENDHDRDERERLFESVREALKPGGAFVVCEPPTGQTSDVSFDFLVSHLRAYGFKAPATPRDKRLAGVYLCVRVTKP